jgi:hypothetical protein
VVAGLASVATTRARVEAFELHDLDTAHGDDVALEP